MNSPPVFIDLSLDEQVQELRKFFKKLGAEISSEKSNKGVEDDLHKIIGVCDVGFKDGGKQDHRILLPQCVSNKKMQTWYPPGDQADVDECILNNEIPNPETWKIIDVAAKIAEKGE